MSYELTFEDIKYDTGYGEECGEMIIELDTTITDESFDHLFGKREQYDVDFTIIYCELFLIGNNGVDLGQVSFDPKKEISDIYKLVSKADIMYQLLYQYGEELFSGAS